MPVDADGIFIPVFTWRRWWRISRAKIAPLLKRGVLGAFVAYGSCGAIMLATRLDRVGEAALMAAGAVVMLKAG